MPYTVALLAAASGQQEPAGTLRIGLLVPIVGAVPPDWFLPRGHGNEDNNV